MVLILVYLTEAPRARLLGLEAPRYAVLEIEGDLCVVVEDRHDSLQSSTLL
jgi:hypothetical protein